MGPYRLFSQPPGLALRNGAAPPKSGNRAPRRMATRFGNSYAKHVLRGTLEYGASALLHEDNRYVPSLDTGFLKRTRHAIASTFVARNDAGHEHFASSRFGSAF